MSEHQFGYRIRQRLNQEAGIDESILLKLETARQQAIQKQRKLAPSAFDVVLDGVLGRASTPESLMAKLLLPSVVLIFGLMAIQSWRQFQIAAEIEEIDTAVLTGDLPIDAYTDTGFDAWLKRSSQ